MLLTDTRPIVLVTGISAAGKSTVAELLSKRFARGVHVKGDVFRRMITSGRHEMTASATDESLEQLQLRYRLGASTADAYHAAGFADVVLGSRLTDYVAAIRSRPRLVVVLIPSPRAVAEREHRRAKTAYRAAFNTIEQLDGALRAETPKIGLWLDSSDQTPIETVDSIVERGLTEGLVR